MNKVFLFFLILLSHSVFSQCTPVIEGDSAACPGVHTYTTDPGKTGYFWRSIGGTIVGEANSQSVDVNWDIAGILRVTYLECENPGVLILDPCDPSSIDELPDKTTNYVYFDMMGRKISDLAAYKGVYVRTNYRHSKLFVKQ